MSPSSASDKSGPNSRPRAQCAEFDPGTAPQVCFGIAPEVVVVPIEPDVAREGLNNMTPRGPASEKTERGKGCWERLGKRQRMWLIGIAIAVCTILVIGVSVPLVSNKAGRSSKSGEANMSSPAPTAPTNTGPASSNNPTVSTLTPALVSHSTNIPIQDSGMQDCKKERFTSDVDWVGIRDGRDWDFDLKGLGSALKCCEYCYQTAKECNAWLYVPAKGPNPDCTLIVKYAGDDADDECPNGRPDVMFNVENDKPDNFAGTGPCSGFTKML